MQDANNGPLSSFAENPTKSVERDTLVDSHSQFAHPEQIENNHVEKAKWPWANGKKNDKMPRFFVIILLICLLVATILFALISLIWALSNNKSQVHEPEIVYTLPTREAHTDSSIHDRVILPNVLKNPIPLSERVIDATVATTTIETPIEATAEPIVESGKQNDEDQDHLESFELDYETTELQTESPTFSPVSDSPSSTAMVTTSNSHFQFYDSIDGETSDTCLERLAMGSPSGVYTIQKVESFRAFCDMDTTNGGWTVIQRRIDSDESFHRGTMKQYIEGFGNLNRSHWLGLEKLHALAPIGSSPATLRIEIQGETCDLTCTKRFANTWIGEWKVNFGRRQDGYKLQITGEGVGNLTFNGVDPLISANGKRFSTVDNDQDENIFMNCAQFRMVGPWWHSKTCSDVGLNGYSQTTSEKYDVRDKNQNAKRYFVWAFDKQTYNGYPYTIHVRKSLILLKSDIGKR